MGKKSKKKKEEQDGDWEGGRPEYKYRYSCSTGPAAATQSDRAPVALTPQPPSQPPDAVPDGASCWICLEEGADESGKPLVRDCSCRGASGWGHLSCIINYSAQLGHPFDKRSQILWIQCPNCHQNYNRKLSVDLADAFLAFTLKTFPCHPRIACPEFQCAPHRYAEALLSKMASLFNQQDNDPKEVVEKARELGLEIVSVIRRMKMIPKEVLRSSIDTNDFSRILYLEYFTYNYLGMCDLIDATRYPSEADADQKRKSALRYLIKYRDMALANQDYSRFKDAEVRISQAHGNQEVSNRFDLDDLRRVYEKDPCIEAGLQLMQALNCKKLIIEYTRLVMELIITSRRVNGPNHMKTKQFQEMLNNVSKRALIAKGGIYQAMRYEGTGHKLVVQGPMAH